MKTLMLHGIGHKLPSFAEMVCRQTFGFGVDLSRLALRAGVSAAQAAQK